MNLLSFGPSWFAIQVKPRYERIAAVCLRQKGYEEFVPLTQTADARNKVRVDKVLYTGYVFCRFDPNISSPIVTTPGVIRLVGNGATPIPIPNTEIEAVRALVNSGCHIYAWPFMNVGDRVRVTEGPFAGAVGILLRLKNAHRFVVSMNVLGRSNAVELQASWVESARHVQS